MRYGINGILLFRAAESAFVQYVYLGNVEFRRGRRKYILHHLKASHTVKYISR
jgi:hypothetical protein